MIYEGLGEPYKTDLLTLYNCDCMELLKQTPDKYYELAIVDPPYGIDVNISMGRRKCDAKSNYHKFAGGDKTIPSKEYFEELFRVSRDVICWGGNYMTEYLPPSPCWILWDKGFSEDVTFAQFEMAWTSFKSSAKKFDKNSKNPNRIHPTEKPVALYKWLLHNYAKPGDKILDTHGGSMSIAIACHQMGFNLTLSELDKDYYNAGVKRVKEETRQTDLFL